MSESTTSALVERVEQQCNQLPPWIRESHPAIKELRRLQAQLLPPWTCGCVDRDEHVRACRLGPVEPPA